MLTLLPTFFHNSTLPKAVSAGVPTLWPSALWIPCASAVTSTLLLRSFDIEEGFRLQLGRSHSCPSICFRCHGVDSGSAQRQNSFSPSFQSAHRQSRCHFVLSFLASPSLPLTLSVTSVSCMLMTLSFSPHLRLTFRWPSTLCVPGVFAGGSPLVSAPPSPPP